MLYIPEFTFNLIFITKLTHSLACQLIFSHNTCLIQERHSLKTIGSAEVRDGLYMLSSSCNVSVPCSSVSNIVVTTNNAWHFRLGHLSDQKLGILCKQYPYISHLNKKACDICPLAKQKRLPFTDSTSHSIHPFDIVHMDIWGPISSPSVHGHRYFLTVVDDFSRYTWIYLMKHKSEVCHLVKSFVSMVLTQFSTRVKVIRSDNGAEFSLKPFYENDGIIHHTSCVETP